MSKFRHAHAVLLALALCSTPIAFAATDDDVPLPKGTPEDEALWTKLDVTEDGWLDGNELNGGWAKFDTDGDEEVTKEEFLAGRAKERAAAAAKQPGSKPATKPASKPNTKPASKSNTKPQAKPA